MTTGEDLEERPSRWVPNQALELTVQQRRFLASRSILTLSCRKISRPVLPRAMSWRMMPASGYWSAHSMPNFKPLDYSPRFLAVDLCRQLVPGTFEYALHHLLEHEIDLAEIEARYRNDEVGASAYEPRVLLKIVLLAYCYGIVSSRGIEAACRDNVRFIAISGDSQPDHSTLAKFVSGLGAAIARVFAQVLMICDRQGLIGREMFAIDGVKLPANASKAKSGKRKDFVRQAQKMQQAVDKILGRHRDNDAGAVEAPLSEREKRQVERLKREAKQINEWLQQHPQERKSAKGNPRLSNRTDN